MITGIKIGRQHVGSAILSSLPASCHVRVEPVYLFWKPDSDDFWPRSHAIYRRVRFSHDRLLWTSLDWFEVGQNREVGFAYFGGGKVNRVRYNFHVLKRRRLPLICVIHSADGTELESAYLPPTVHVEFNLELTSSHGPNHRVRGNNPPAIQNCNHEFSLYPCKSSGS